RPRALQHHLRHLPRPRRRRRERGRQADEPPQAAVAGQGRDARPSARPVLPHHHLRLRPHAVVPDAALGARPLGGRRLHPRAPARQRHQARRSAGARARRGPEAPRRRAVTPQGIRIALIAGVVGAIATIIGFVVDTQQAFFSYLFAYAYVFTAAGGALILVLIRNAARSRWVLVFRRRAEAFAFVLVPLAVLFIPILFGLTHLYPWHRPTLPHDALQAYSIEHARPYLNTTFFVIRAIVYFAVLIGAFAVLRPWSLPPERDGAR